VDLATLAGLQPTGVICEIVNDDGTMARVPDLARFCRRHDLLMITVAEIARFRLESECDQLWINRHAALPLDRRLEPHERRAHQCRVGRSQADPTNGSSARIQP
jgi:3,4-dihydroxy-2-butanone 4-phosphate synthase